MADTWTVQDVLNWTTGFFTARNIPESRLNAELLLAHVLGCKRIELYIQFERILTGNERNSYKALIQRRSKREPVQYILGETEFMGLPFRVNPAVLIPRPDTETLVDAVLEEIADHPGSLHILDIGCGSGCIAISLAKMLPQAKVDAVEISPEAAKVAAENSEINQVELNIHTMNVFSMQNKYNRNLDIIVSNPPYIAEDEWSELEPEVTEHEPKQALLAGADGLSYYKKLIPLSRDWLAPNGRIYLEVGHTQAESVAEILNNFQFNTIIRKDYRGIDRVVVAKVDL